LKHLEHAVRILLELVGRADGPRGRAGAEHEHGNQRESDDDVHGGTSIHYTPSYRTPGTDEAPPSTIHRVTTRWARNDLHPRRRAWSIGRSDAPDFACLHSASDAETLVGSWYAERRRSASAPSRAPSSSASITSTPRHRTATASPNGISVWR